MRKKLVHLVALGSALLVLAGCAKSTRRARPFPPPYYPAMGLPPEPPKNYAQPFAVPAASAAPAPGILGGGVPNNGANSVLGPCDEKCQASLKSALGAQRTGADVLADYKKDCEAKAKLLGCGAFRSKAVGADDENTLALLATCERERAEACEDIKTSSPPLVAWHQTLKKQHCKDGYTALCANYRECKRPTGWGCRKAADGQEVCGCIPRCQGEVKAETATRSWPDGSRRGSFSCAP